jgi:hypothetical protein
MMAEKEIAAVRSFVEKTLPTLTAAQLEIIMNWLVDLGVDDLDYLQYVEATQLNSELKPVLIAKLLATACNAGN